MDLAKERIRKINEITELLKLMIEQRKEIINEKEFFFQLSEKFGCTKRLAKEYYEIAKRRI